MKKIWMLLSFGDSRKVAMGLWIFVVAIGLLVGGKINSTDWLTCMFLSTALVGGGTISDKFMEVKRGPDPVK